MFWAELSLLFKSQRGRIHIKLKKNTFLLLSTISVAATRFTAQLPVAQTHTSVNILWNHCTFLPPTHPTHTLEPSRPRRFVLLSTECHYIPYFKLVMLHHGRKTILSVLTPFYDAPYRRILFWSTSVTLPYLFKFNNP